MRKLKKKKFKYVFYNFKFIYFYNMNNLKNRYIIAIICLNISFYFYSEKTIEALLIEVIIK